MEAHGGSGCAKGALRSAKRQGEPEWSGWESVRMGGSDNKGDGLCRAAASLCPETQVRPATPGNVEAHGGGGRTETQRGRLWTACGQRCVDGKNSQTTPTTTNTTSIRQLLGAADAQTAHHATFSTAPTHQLLGSANAETTPAGAPAAAADRTQRPDATCEGKNG